MALLALLSAVIVLLSVGQSEGRHEGVEYWRGKLGMTVAIPETLREMAVAGGSVSDYLQHLSKEGNELNRLLDTKLYMVAADEAADPSIFLFFLMKDMREGAKMTLHFTSHTPRPSFLSRPLADAIPFSSRQFSQILPTLNISHTHPDIATFMMKTLKKCELPAVDGETKKCATSLESMVDFATSQLGTCVNLSVVPTNAPKQSVKQEYTITAISSFQTQTQFGSSLVACHNLQYPYAVYYCHRVHKTKAVKITLKAADGTTAHRIAVCHADTSTWNPKNIAFKMLGVKPGDASICHFTPNDSIVWLPSN